MERLTMYHSMVGITVDGGFAEYAIGEPGTSITVVKLSWLQSIQTTLVICRTTCPSNKQRH